MKKAIVFELLLTFACYSEHCQAAERNVPQCDTIQTFFRAQRYLGNHSLRPSIRSVGLEQNARAILICVRSNNSAKRDLDLITAAIQLREAGELANENKQTARAHALVRESLAMLSMIHSAGLAPVDRDTLETATQTAKWDLQGNWQII
jgi:hypothetical protein